MVEIGNLDAPSAMKRHDPREFAQTKKVTVLDSDTQLEDKARKQAQQRADLERQIAEKRAREDEQRKLREQQDRREEERIQQAIDQEQ